MSSLIERQATDTHQLAKLKCTDSETGEKLTDYRWSGGSTAGSEERLQVCYFCTVGKLKIRDFDLKMHSWSPYSPRAGGKLAYW